MNTSRCSNPSSRILVLVLTAFLGSIAALPAPARGDEPPQTQALAAATSPEENAMRTSLQHASRDNIRAWAVCDVFRQRPAAVSDSDLALCAKLEGLRKSDLELRSQREQAKEKKTSLATLATTFFAMFPLAGMDPEDIRKYNSLKNEISTLTAQILAGERQHLRYARQLMQSDDADPAHGAPSTSLASTPPNPAPVAAPGADRRPAVLSGSAATPAPTR